MTDRERWTVYPLLFLALGIALRSSGKFGPTKLISCEHLLVATPDAVPMLDALRLEMPSMKHYLVVTEDAPAPPGWIDFQ